MTIKYECVYLNNFQNGLQARLGINDWLNHDNETRPHSTFNGQTPREVYNGTIVPKDNFPLMLNAA